MEQVVTSSSLGKDNYDTPIRNLSGEWVTLTSITGDSVYLPFSQVPNLVVQLNNHLIEGRSQ